MNNIILIGMSGAGKSTIGVLLAKALGYAFIDVDLVIQKQQGCLLQAIIDKEGIQQFIAWEERACKSIRDDKTVIATGGSVIYSHEAMKHLKQLGQVIYLDVSYNEIKRRLENIETRGIVRKEGQSLKDVYEEREGLYRKYCDCSIQCDHKDIECIVTKLYKHSITLGFQCEQNGK